MRLPTTAIERGGGGKRGGDGGVSNRFYELARSAPIMFRDAPVGVAHFHGRQYVPVSPELLHALLEKSPGEMQWRRLAKDARVVYQILKMFCAPRKPLAEVCPLVNVGSTRVQAEEIEMALKIGACNTYSSFADQAGQTAPGER